MKIVCTQENLKSGLQVASKVISGSGTLPVLNTVLLQTESGQLKISATNLEIGVSTSIRCKIEKEGSICVPAKPLVDVIASLPNKNITLELSGTELLVTSEQAHIKIKTISPEEFPIIPNVDGGETIQIPSKDFKIALDQVVFSASSSETQPEISGVLLAFKDKVLKIAATDRYRLAEKHINIIDTVKDRRLIVPHKSITEVSRIIGESSENIIIGMSDTQIVFKIKETQLVSRLIDGQFPPYEEIIPKNFLTILQINQKQLLSALKTVSVFSTGSNGVRFNYSDEGVKINAVSDAFGEGVSEVECLVTGPAGSVLFNHRYVQDVLNVISEELIEIKVVGENSPVIFSPAGNNSYLYLVMPITT